LDLLVNCGLYGGVSDVALTVQRDVNWSSVDVGEVQYEVAVDEAVLDDDGNNLIFVWILKANWCRGANLAHTCCVCV